MGNLIWIWIVIIDIVLLGLVAGAVIMIARSRTTSYKQQYQKEQESKADNILASAQEKARALELEGKDRALRALKEAEDELSRRRSELSKEEERLTKRRADVDFRLEKIEQRDQLLAKRQGQVDRRANEIEKMHAQEVVELQRIAEMSTEEARGVLLQEAEKDARNDMARIIRQIEAEARAEGEKRARELVADAIQRVASEHVAAVTTSLVSLPNEEMKGRIVGRNGRNIRAFEQAAGVDVIVDDTPEAVTVSCSIRCGAKSLAVHWSALSSTAAFTRHISKRSSTKNSVWSTRILKRPANRPPLMPTSLDCIPKF